MLQACGSVKSFKRLITPANKPQGFGFAEFEDPDGALRAMALLNNVELPALEDGCVSKKLLVRTRLFCEMHRLMSLIRSKRMKRPRCSLTLIRPSECKQTCVVTTPLV
jgi:RNA recognition motif-containing protein